MCPLSHPPPHPPPLTPHPVSEGRKRGDGSPTVTDIRSSITLSTYDTVHCKCKKTHVSIQNTTLVNIEKKTVNNRLVSTLKLFSFAVWCSWVVLGESVDDKCDFVWVALSDKWHIFSTPKWCHLSGADCTIVFEKRLTLRFCTNFSARQLSPLIAN